VPLERGRMASNRHPQHGGASRRTLLLLALIAAAGLGCTAAVGANLHRAPTPRNALAAYNWPVRPFDRPHPIRGAFGDPRTSFNGAPTYAGLRGPGAFAFHQGVDISAPDGTAVYAVKSGIARLRSRETVVVRSDHGVVMEYWHIVPAIRPGQRVTAYETVLGRIRFGSEHVHLTELRNGRPVNPLSPGHLMPYVDHTNPYVGSALYFESGSERRLLPEFLHGRVQLAVAAADPTAMSIPGRWNGMAVSPARITWHIESAKTRAVVVPETEAYDVRERLPENSDLWRAYARGTRQNMANFAGHKMWRQPGMYLFRLIDSFDTHRLKDDIYLLVATASDTRGNSGSRRFVFTIHNKPGFFR
jgi:peptidase M23-like protein